ncbi:MAG: AAA family ATPase [Candidatus Thermoplasmatota archaeon]|nr:AAA family ATPase [Candidatus Thermoplasmatota archaeon]
MRDNIKMIPTYVDGLDEALGGGIPEGNVVLLCGNPGTMKTSLAFSILYHNSHNGRKGLYVTLEENAEDLKSAMQNMGMENFHESELYLLDMGRLRLELAEAETDNDWLTIFEGVIREALRVASYSLIVMDSLESLYASKPPPDPRRHLFNLFGFLKDAGVTALIISEIPFGTSRLAEHGVDFLADGIILLKQFEAGDSNVQLRLRCVKMRKVKHERADFVLDIAKGRFAVTRLEKA